MGGALLRQCGELSFAMNSEQVVETLEFPCAVPGTDLVVENMVCYDGPFLENGDLQEVQEATAIMITNCGLSGVSEGAVTVWQEGRQLVFLLTQLPPEASVLILEQNGQQYSQVAPECIAGWTVCTDSGWNPEEKLEIQQLPPGGLQIRNVGEEVLLELRLCYKPAYEDGAFLMGGRTYEALVGNLLPGESMVIYPEHYCTGVSKIIRLLYDATT